MKNEEDKEQNYIRNKIKIKQNVRKRGVVEILLRNLTSNKT